MASIQQWILNAQETRENGIYGVELHADDFAAAYDSVGGTRIHERDKNRFASSHFQGRQYERALNALFAATGSKGAALDVGCGDGRGMAWLLQHGFEPLIGADVSADALKRARTLLPSADYFLVHGGLLDLDLAPASFDLVLAIESLHYLDGRYEEGVDRIAECLKPGGLVISSEPDWEAGLLYAALCGRLDELADLAKRRRTYEHIDQPRQVRSFHPLEKSAIFERAGLKEIERRGISALPLFLIHFFYNTKSGSSEAQTAIIEALDEVISHDTTFNRLFLTVHEKY